MVIAQTKIQRPRLRSGLVLPRPALEQRVVDALDAQRVLLVCAPAGSGKTALLVRALERWPHAAAWISLDAGDDLHRLLECLLMALEPFDLPWRVAPEGLLAQAAQGSDASRVQVADALINALDAAEAPRGVIVFDDLHHLDDPACLGFLDHWLQRGGSRWSLVLASRHEPSLRLSRLRTAGELAELRAEQLQFSLDEARAMLMAAGIDAASSEALHRRCAGWAAGLRLAASGARGRAAGGAIDRQAFDFLATEVLARIEPPLREFLVRTSVLHELDAVRCAALTGDARAAHWLDEIERRGLFVTVTDATPPTLRLHDLFREALQQRLRIEQPDAWPELLERAAAGERDPVRRQALLLAAQQPDDAARALLEAAPELNTSGGAATVLRMLDAFEPAFAASSAEWQRVAGLATQTVWRMQDAERHYAAAAALYRSRGDAACEQVMVVRRAAVLVALGRLDDAGVLMRALGSEPLIETEARLIAATATIWLHLERGENDLVAPVFDDLLRQLQHCTSLTDWGTIPSPRQSACRGMAALSLRWAQGALAIAGDRPLPLRTFAHLVLGWRALWLGRVAESQALLDRTLADASWGGHEVIARSHGLALQAALAVVRGEAEQALQTMRQRIDEQPAGYGGWGLWHVLYFAARIAAAAARAAPLREWLAKLDRQHETLSDLTPARLRPELGLRGALAALEGDTALARTHWQELLAHEAHADLLGHCGEVRVRLARLARDAGDLEYAAGLLLPLLERPDDGPRGAVFAGADLALLAQADWAGHLGDDAAATLRGWAAALARTGDPATATAAPADDPLSDRVGATGERLTARELEVLALIARGQSNKLIARALELSPHTVKRHVANVLGKLGVDTRGQAAAWFHAQPH